MLLRALDEVAAPAIDLFHPTWVLVSAGFDAHRDDPMADLALSSGDFARLATTVAAYVPGPGRLALILEGGYHLGALRDSVRATLGALMGHPSLGEAPTSGGPGAAQVATARPAPGRRPLRRRVPVTARGRSARQAVTFGPAPEGQRWRH